MTIGAAVPAYQNSANLRRCLVSLAQVSPALLERTVVVDDSDDGRVAEALKSEFANVHWIVHDRNRGFGPSANEAVSACPAEIVMLLNDDVTLLTDPSAILRTLFRRQDLFAVTFQSRHADGSFREGAKRLVWPMGLPRILHNPKDQVPVKDGLQLSSYAVGGHAAYRKEMFTSLGGFDPLFEPFYWEDVDLCKRAQANGWQTVFSPDCIVMHDDRGAIRSTFDQDRIGEIVLRNRLLFARRHGPTYLWPLRALTLTYRLALSALSHDRMFLKAYRLARDRWQQFSGASHYGKD
jgi:GT2 family glycosyltransferase